MLVLLVEIGSLGEKLANGYWNVFKIVAVAFDFVHHLVLVVGKWVLQKHVEHRTKYLCCLYDWLKNSSWKFFRFLFVSYDYFQ